MAGTRRDLRSYGQLSDCPVLLLHIADSGIRAPDALQLACAGSFGVDLFVTNDSRLFRKKVDGVQFIVPLDRLPF